jgi:hypothetical protein
MQFIAQVLSPLLSLCWEVISSFGVWTGNKELATGAFNWVSFVPSVDWAWWTDPRCSHQNTPYGTNKTVQENNSWYIHTVTDWWSSKKEDVPTNKTLIVWGTFSPSETCYGIADKDKQNLAQVHWGRTLMEEYIADCVNQCRSRVLDPCGRGFVLYYVAGYQDDLCAVAKSASTHGSLNHCGSSSSDLVERNERQKIVSEHQSALSYIDDYWSSK